MVDELRIDAAMDSLSEAISSMLRRNGREGASGACRAITQRLQAGDVARAAAMMGCSEAEAQALKERFGDL